MPDCRDARYPLTGVFVPPVFPLHGQSSLTACPRRISSPSPVCLSPLIYAHLSPKTSYIYISISNIALRSSIEMPFFFPFWSNKEVFHLVTRYLLLVRLFHPHLCISLKNDLFLDSCRISDIYEVKIRLQKGYTKG